MGDPAEFRVRAERHLLELLEHVKAAREISAEPDSPTERSALASAGGAVKAYLASGLISDDEATDWIRRLSDLGRQAKTEADRPPLEHEFGASGLSVATVHLSPGLDPGNFGGAERAQLRRIIAEPRWSHGDAATTRLLTIELYDALTILRWDMAIRDSSRAEARERLARSFRLQDSDRKKYEPVSWCFLEYEPLLQRAEAVVVPGVRDAIDGLEVTFADTRVTIPL